MLDEQIKTLFEPLVKAMGKEHEQEAWAIIEKEEQGVFAWGVKTGYLLWTRTNPGKQPTREQIQGWMAIASFLSRK